MRLIPLHINCLHAKRVKAAMNGKSGTALQAASGIKNPKSVPAMMPSHANEKFARVKAGSVSRKGSLFQDKTTEQRTRCKSFMGET